LETLAILEAALRILVLDDEMRVATSSCSSRARRADDRAIDRPFCKYASGSCRAVPELVLGEHGVLLPRVS